MEYRSGLLKNKKSPNWFSKDQSITQKRIMEQIENEKIMVNNRGGKGLVNEREVVLQK